MSRDQLFIPCIVPKRKFVPEDLCPTDSSEVRESRGRLRQIGHRPLFHSDIMIALGKHDGKVRRDVDAGGNLHDGFPRGVIGLRAFWSVVTDPEKTAKGVFEPSDLPGENIATSPRCNVLVSQS